jgi:outer membrane receptor protein involved in Fe transport
MNVGINNITDRIPPIAGSTVAGPPYGNGNTYPQVYDALGRYVFLGLTAKF